MKRVLTGLAALLTLTVMSLQAQAIMFEPYAGYEVGDAGSNASTYKGTTFGARLGFDVIPMFTLGVDYAMGSHTQEGILSNTDWSVNDLGVFAMFEFPVLIRAWLTYSFDTKASTSGVSDMKGTATKIGVGYTGLPFISINLEMVKRNYTEQGSATIDSSSDTYLVSVGIPLP